MAFRSLATNSLPNALRETASWLASGVMHSQAASPLSACIRCFLAGILLYVSLNLIFGEIFTSAAAVSTEVYYAQF
ncbi:hypothetical protein NNJEOMEG_03343 [Fundidesulfovibrio magnetotacticus]|uniref:Uncharacterized protein n=1 Tax=Fundidesulfovibrio magnetotacticus TaxID=2730080 RepID=A0A6V8LZ18_9BACT|nr:hypothetical protein NNJEOMEG_03343 [Fundidesulfovibrio magnetotacticus]